MFKLPNGQRIAPGTAFKYDGRQYSADWIQKAAPWQKDAIGLVEIIEQPRPDDRFYTVSQNDDGSWNKTPKDLDPLKATAIAQIKQAAESYLNVYNYKVFREVSGGKPMTQVDKDAMAAIRATSNALEAEVNAMASVEELAAWQPHGWPDA